jgi:hypothetical protein
MFFRGSRYENIAQGQITRPDGRVIAYARMRFIPATAATPAYTTRQGDRPDLVAYTTLGDPERFWQLCDANLVQRPADLTAAPGTRLLAPGPRTN